MRRHHLLLILGVCALLLTPTAGGGPAVPGDPTPPVVTPHIFGTLGLSGWYVSNVTVNWTVEDPESQILETQGCNAITLVNDTTGTPLTCYARSDGGETTVTITIRVDKTAPTVTATPARSPDSNGWYNHALSVGFSGTDATSGIDSCVPSQTYSGPDSGNASVSGSCRDHAGNTGTRTFGLSYDATAPQVTGANASRGPDHAGWYNHTLSIAFTGADVTSGLDTCTQSTYSGPDDATASVNGTCRDRAGNTSAPSAVQLPVRRDGAVRNGHALEEPGLERLVQPRALGQLQRERSDIGDRHLRTGTGLLGPGQRQRVRQRLVYRPRWEHHGPAVQLQLRRNRSAGDQRDSLALSRSRRLVQPHLLDRVRGHGCDFGNGHVHAGHLLGAR